jgi:Tol biopolymer transport system component
MNNPSDRLAAALADRYRIERELGAGGMATVYLAEDLKHDRKVAIKVLKPELAAVLGAERFVVEIKTTAAMSHPHILPLFDSGTADGFLFYVMPYIQGETIREKLNRETQFGVDEAVRIAREVADALDYAHRHGVIHRDIKPENLLLHDGRAMVMDFGIALAVSAAAGGRMTETGLSLGTPHYMSPEQATAEKEITARSDIYSLASVLYEMLAGQPPHVGGAAQQVIMKIITEQAQPVSAIRKSVPANVDAALAKALEKLPADRFESAKAFAEALANAAFRTDTAAGGAQGEPRGRNRLLLTAAGLALLAGGVALGAALWRAAPIAKPVVRFTLPLVPGEPLALDLGMDSPVALSPDGNRIAYVTWDSGRTAPYLHLRTLDQFTTTLLPGTKNAVNPFFSPEGAFIGFITRNDNTIRKIAVAGGPASAIVGNAATNGGAPAWGDDHSVVYVNAVSKSGNLEMSVVRDAGGTPSRLGDSTEVLRYAAPSMLPGGKAVLLTVCDRLSPANECLGSLAVRNLTTGKVDPILPNAQRGWYLPGGYLVYSTREGAVFAVRFDADRLSVTSPPVSVLDGVNVGPNRLAQLSISASGTLAYVPATPAVTSVIVQVDRSGREQVIVANPARYTMPRVSPSGDRIAVTMADAAQVNQIWIHDRASISTRQLTSEGVNARATWSPEGKELAFFSTRANGTIWRAPADGSAPGRNARTGPPLNGSAAVSWTRDGKWIVWDGQISGAPGAGGDDIYANSAGDTSALPRAAVATARAEQAAEVSPDGKWIAYVTDDVNNWQVYVQPFLSPGGRTLVSAGSSNEPAWVSNNELVYVNTDSDSVTLARLDFGASVKVTRTALFDHRPYQPGLSAWRNYDVAPGGKSFVFLKPVGKAVSVEPIVVLNWVEEVKRLMAAAGVR